MNSTLFWLSSGFLTAVLAVIIPVSATAASAFTYLEADAPQVNTSIEEWHWRNMSY
ncbi:MAG: hypothetical protein AAF959_16495 [Cyanobacteria bacterium P01_D01_bin.56]